MLLKYKLHDAKMLVLVLQQCCVVRRGRRGPWRHDSQVGRLDAQCPKTAGQTNLALNLKQAMRCWWNGNFEQVVAFVDCIIYHVLKQGVDLQCPTPSPTETGPRDKKGWTHNVTISNPTTNTRPCDKRGGHHSV